MTYEAGKHIQKMLTLFLWAFWQGFEKQISYMGELKIWELLIRETLYCIH
jgi:hypothetical protein